MTAGRVPAIHRHHHRHTVLRFYVVCYTLGWVLVSLEASIIGYWILAGLLGIILTVAHGCVNAGDDYAMVLDKGLVCDTVWL